MREDFGNQNMEKFKKTSPKCGWCLTKADTPETIKAVNHMGYCNSLCKSYGNNFRCLTCGKYDINQAKKSTRLGFCSEACYRELQAQFQEDYYQHCTKNLCNAYL